MNDKQCSLTDFLSGVRIRLHGMWFKLVTDWKSGTPSNILVRAMVVMWAVLTLVIWFALPDNANPPLSGVVATVISYLLVMIGGAACAITHCMCKWVRQTCDLGRTSRQIREWKESKQ